MVLKEFNKKKNSQILIVTGLSGAGKNVVMRSLEDLGFYCVDNLPVPLVSTFLKFAFKSQDSILKVALGIDARGKRFVKDFMQEIEELKKLGDGEYFFKVVFLNSDYNTLLKRFQETRRSHPLAKGASVLSAIQTEKRLFEPIMQLADIVLDTDNFNIHELRRWVREALSGESHPKILVNLISFGFKYGVPSESSVVYDVRFLPNPYFMPALKAHDGRDKEVQEYLFQHQEVVDYWRRVCDFLHYSIQKYYQEGRSFVNVAIGCTGGKHRSVTFVERLHLERWDNVAFLVHHRDVEK